MSECVCVFVCVCENMSKIEVKYPSILIKGFLPLIKII